MLYPPLSTHPSWLPVSTYILLMIETHTSTFDARSLVEEPTKTIFQPLQTLILSACIYVTLLKDYFAQPFLLCQQRYHLNILKTCVNNGALVKTILRKPVYDSSEIFVALAGIIALNRQFDDNERHFWPFSRILLVWNP
jgi:hypothetical protein